MKKTNDQPPKQEELFTAFQQYFSLRHLNMPSLSTAQSKKHFTWVFMSFCYHPTLSFTVRWVLLCIQQLILSFKFIFPFSTVFTVWNHIVFILDASLEDIQMQFKLQPLIKQYVCCIKPLLTFFPLPLDLTGEENEFWMHDRKYQLSSTKKDLN